MRFHKYHALGNDYVVMNPAHFGGWDVPSPAQIRAICQRNLGVGSDGILWGPLPATAAQFRLRIFNPDGSESEKSGNGLRIFSLYLYDQRLVGSNPFTIETSGGLVGSQVLDEGRSIVVSMGRVTFLSDEIPVAGPRREVLSETLSVLGHELTFSAAGIGNPHCVVPASEVSAEQARKFGSAIEVHRNFPNRTNVQFMKVLDRQRIQIEIWERGAGYTRASGSSASASAAVAHRLGLVDATVVVHMPGGRLSIDIAPDFGIQMSGPATRVFNGALSPELLDATD